MRKLSVPGTQKLILVNFNIRTARVQDVVLSVVVDICLGVVGVFAFQQFLAIGGDAYLSRAYYLAGDLTREGIVWLMGNPAGVKLNPVLNSFLGRLFLYLLESWDGMFVYLYCYA